MKKTKHFFWPAKAGSDLHMAGLPVRIFVLLLFCGLMNLAAVPAYSSSANDLIPGSELQQQIKVTGTVVDAATGQPMAGVNIVAKGTTVGAITDANGKYAMPLPVDPNATLVFSFIGYVTREVPVGGKTVVDVLLSTTVRDLEEVVVVGYGTQKRANVVGAVTSISGASLQTVPATNVTNALEGRLTGAWMRQATGEPGQFNTGIMIRGRTNLGSNSAPLVIIDGVQGRNMDEIDPNDVASISILKDASAAIYGASAANGVILITTKKGQEGKPRLSYQFFQGFMTPTIIPKVTNAGDYATMLSEYQINQGKTRTYTDADIGLFYSGADPWQHPNTDWYGDLVKKWTTTSRHNFTIDGGVRGMTYLVSFGLKQDESMYKQSSTKYDQYNLRAKVDLPITDWLKTGVDIAAFQIHRVYPYKSADAIVGQSTRLLPTQWSFWPNGKPGPDIEYGDNPVVTSTFAGGKDDQLTYRVLNTFSGSITPPFIKGLSINGSYSYDLTNYYRKRFFQPWTLYVLADPKWVGATRDPVTGFVTDMPLTPALRGLSSPEDNEDYERTINRTINININYTKKFGDHNVGLFVGFEQYTNDRNNFWAYRKYYISTLIQTISAGGDLDKNNSGGASIYARKSYIGRLTYDYQGKYLAEVIFRRDGSLKWNPDGRWGNFPGAMVGWRASEENFWKNTLSFINYFKLRASWGQMGMDPGNPFQYVNTFGLSSGMVFGQSGAIETAVGPPTIANPNITWEVQTTQNIGFDSKFLNDLIHLNAEFFWNKREHLLVTRDASIPNFSGLTLPQENLGKVDSKGFEIDAGIHKTLTSNLRFDITGNFSFARNKVVFMDEPARPVEWQKRTGKPFGDYPNQLVYHVLGVFSDDTYTVNGVPNYPRWNTAKPGDLIFEDVNKDGLIDGNDRILLDHTDAPETFYGATIDATWKDFSLSLLIQGQGKYNRWWAYDERRGEAGNYLQWTFDNRWQKMGDVTNVPRAFNRNDYYWGQSVQRNDYWYNDRAYCRLKSLVITYNIPTSLYKRFGISRASIFVSGNNLALIYAKSRWFDPEVNDPGVYPTMKTYAVGANITF
jgi:TonB-dependent starch-binding outer membrane protein SusC